MPAAIAAADLFLGPRAVSQPKETVYFQGLMGKTEKQQTLEKSMRNALQSQASR